MSPDLPGPVGPELRSALRSLTDLRHAHRLLSWDETINMPARGSQARGRAIGALATLERNRWADPGFGAAIPADESWWSVRREHEVACRVPADLVAEVGEAASAAIAAWRQARQANDFAVFAPYLRRNVELQRRWSECFPEAEHPYDPLLQRFEPGMSTEQFRQLIETLHAGLAPIQAALGNEEPVQRTLDGTFPLEEQRAAALEVARWLGVEEDAARFADAPHPFTYRIGSGDVRFTSRWDPGDLRSGFMCVLHEAGHTLYEQAFAPELDDTMLDEIASFGLHESQARLCENLVGRSRAFWEIWLPRLQGRFPDLARYDVDSWLVQLNAVRPTTIRVEADELTYHQHIQLRFEIEVDLVTGELDPADVAERWDERTLQLTGAPVQEPVRGVLQDIHWCFGELGYFPTYTIGSMMASQLWLAAGEALGDPARLIQAGEVSLLRDWLRDNVHQFGRTRTATEILAAATGGPLSAQPLIDHLRERYGADPSRVV